MGKIDQIVRENSEKIFPIGPSDAPVAKNFRCLPQSDLCENPRVSDTCHIERWSGSFIKDNRLYQNVAVGFDFNPVNGF